jgi:hypothetical protein
MDASIVKPVAYGLLAGLIFSVALGIHSKRGATGITHTLFGMSSSELINATVILVMTFSLVIAAVFSILIQDWTYPREHPIPFTIETLAVSFFPALIIFIIMYLRNKKFTGATYLEYLALAVKFGLVHILFQFAGIYSSVFGI